MTYRIKIRPKALKFIEKQDKRQRIRIYKAIYNLPKGDVKKLTNSNNNDFRLRIRRLSNHIYIKSKRINYFNH